MPIQPPREIFAPVELCGAEGRLNPAARGFSRRPYIHADIPGPLFRRKRWNFLFISHPDILVAVALSNADYAGLAFLWLYDLKARRFREFEQMLPLGLGTQLGPSMAAPATLHHRRIQVDWTRDGDDVDVRVDIPAMPGPDREPLSLRVRVTLPPTDDQFHLVVPWSDRVFNYTAKLAALPAQGQLSIGAQQYPLDAPRTTASIDFTRGIWPYRSAWNWSAASGRIGDRRVGLNFGAGWTDGTGVLENVLFVDGKIVPLWEPIGFVFDSAQPLSPWRMRTTESDRVDLTFTPVYSRGQDTNMVVMRMQLKQVMGHFSGRIHLPDGTPLSVQGLPGIAEDHIARW